MFSISRKRAPRLARVLAVAAVAVGALPATALADCPKVATIQQTFQEFDGDLNYYFMAPGGTFEDQVVATTTGTTKLFAPDHRVMRAGIKAALSMNNGSTVTTGAFCVDNTRHWMRFLYRRNSASGTMKVEAIRANGTATLLANITPARSSDWEAGTLVPLSGPLALPVLGSENVKIRLTAGGGWDVDGIAIDPYRS